MMEPLVITAYLRCGVISDPWLPLDGLLLYEMCRRENGGPADASMPGLGSALALAGKVPPSPLALVRDGCYQYHACSFAHWGLPCEEGRDHWNKRFDASLVDLLDARYRRIDTGSGRYRSYHMPVFYRVAPWVRWYAVGNRDAVRSLLERVPALGKKRVHGWGRVTRWEVERVECDRSLIVDGVPQRSIPVTPQSRRIVRDATVMVWGFRPPYYEPGGQAECFMPPGPMYDTQSGMSGWNGGGNAA